MIDELPSISQVNPHIYLSDIESAYSRSVLMKCNIKRIVSVTPHDEDGILRDLCQSLGIEQMRFPIRDRPFVDEKNTLANDILPWMHAAQESLEVTLVHCGMGISRSPSLVITYLVWRGMSFGEALTLVQEKHLRTNPFPDVLDSFLKCIGLSVPDGYRRQFRFKE